jgi:hypothetical protein
MYEPLEKFLIHAPKDEHKITLSFEQIEMILNKKLPQSARTDMSWWANQEEYRNHPQVNAWMSAGFEVDRGGVNIDEEWVRFKRR